MKAWRRAILAGCLAVGSGLQAGGPPAWDLQYSLTTRHHEFEVAYLPVFVEARPRYVFSNLRASVSLVKQHDKGEAGVRLHVDGMAGEQTWYATGGLFLAGGEGMGAALGLRLGGGVRFNDHARMGVVADVAGGTEGASGSIGLQLGLTF